MMSKKGRKMRQKGPVFLSRKEKCNEYQRKNAEDEKKQYENIPNLQEIGLGLFILLYD